MFTEDFSVFFAVDHFAVAATWTPAGGVAVPLQVIFDHAYYETPMGNTVVAGLQPMCLVADDRIPGIARADTIAIEGSNYTVIDIEPDGTGVTTLRLEGPITAAPGSGIGFELEDGSGSILQESGDHILTEDAVPSSGVGLEDGSGSIELEDGSGVISNE